MPYSIKEGPCQTADGIGGQYAVIKDDDGMQMGCHQTREAAVDQIAALEASEELKVLPESYRPSMDDAVNCGTCKHYAHSYCHLWQDNVMNDYVCDAYAAGDVDDDEDESGITIEIEVKQKEVAPQDVRAAYRRGIELYEEGFGGEGLEPSTIRVARAISRGEAIGEEQIRKGYRFWARNERFLDFDAESPAGVAALLWGGRPGMQWFRRLYAKLEDDTKTMNIDDLLVTFGDDLEIKRLEDGGLEVKGFAVRFTGPDDTDLEGDYFTGETDFGPAKEVGLYYHHGMDKELGRQRIGTAALEKKDAGLWMQAQMKLREDYEKAIEDMVRRKKMGISSGAAGHLVERVKTEGGNLIKQWVIAEVSLTPTPAEPRNVVSLKSLLNGATGDDPQAVEQTADIGEPEEVETPQTTEPQDTEVKMENTEQKAEIVAPTLDQIASLMDDKFKAFQTSTTAGKTTNVEFATSVNSKTKRGDDEMKALAYFIRTGDAGAMKASNDTDMNVGTAGDGGNAVPTGHFQNIIARRDESMLARQLGVTLIPGKGTTVNVPLDGEDDGEFVSKGEGTAFDRDAPAIGTAAMTLVKYTKKIELSVELLEDEDSRLLDFLANFVGRGMAKTHNNLLITEALANGTKTDDFAQTAIAAGDLEQMVFDDDLSAYLDDSGSVGWIMKPSTYASVISIASSNTRFYHANVGDTASPRPTVLGYPVFFSNKISAIGSGNKSVIFGNMSQMGYREAPGLTFLRDPYSKAGNGQVVLHYYFRTVYKVLQAEAVGYGQHATA
jgi:HK97 family phage major capsid protein